MSKHNEITSEILSMASIDRNARENSLKNGKTWDDSIDKIHTLRMKEIVKEIGWPTISKVGIEASHMSWLLVQHADHDPDFQQHCLNLLKQSSEEEIQKMEIAYLEDRILTGKGKPQIYGTQFQKNEKGKFIPKLLANPKTVNQRRKIMGLNPIEEYAKKFI